MTQEIQQLHQQLSSSEERQRREVRGKEDTIARLQGEAREKEDTITILEGEVRGKEEALSSVRDQLTGQRERHVTELRQVRLEMEQYQQQLRKEQAQHQLLVTRIATAMSHLRGEAVAPQALKMWELPREEVHITDSPGHWWVGLCGQRNIPRTDSGSQVSPSSNPLP